MPYVVQIYPKINNFYCIINKIMLLQKCIKGNKLNADEKLTVVGKFIEVHIFFFSVDGKSKQGSTVSKEFNQLLS